MAVIREINQLANFTLTVAYMQSLKRNLLCVSGTKVASEIRVLVQISFKNMRNSREHHSK